MSRIILLATANRHKAEEIQALLSGLRDLQITSLDRFPGYVSPEETGSTLKENALIKAHSACEYTGLPVLADDSGLFIPALDGFPGVKSARCAGENADDKDRISYILNELKPGVDRTAYFACCAVLARPESEPVVFEGRAFGNILEESSGDGGFGYDPVFYYPPLQKTFAELSAKEKNRVSHRAAAFQKAAVYLKEIHLAL